MLPTAILDQSLNTDKAQSRDIRPIKEDSYKQYRDLENILAKKSRFSFIDQVIAASVRISKLPSEQVSNLLKKAGNDSKLSPGQISALSKFLEEKDIPLKTSEMQYVFAAKDFISYALMQPEYSEVFISYGIIAVSLASVDGRDQDVKRNCQYYDTLEKIAKSISSKPFSTRYPEIKDYASKLAVTDVYLLRLKDGLEKSNNLKGHIAIIKYLKAFKSLVEYNISASTSQPFVECLNRCNVKISEMLEKAEVLQYTALLQYQSVQSILSNQIYKEELQKSTNGLDAGSSKPLVEKIYTMPALKDIRKSLKDISPDGNLSDKMVKVIIGNALKIQQKIIKSETIRQQTTQRGVVVRSAA